MNAQPIRTKRAQCHSRIGGVALVTRNQRLRPLKNDSFDGFQDGLAVTIAAFGLVQSLPQEGFLKRLRKTNRGFFVDVFDGTVATMVERGASVSVRGRVINFFSSILIMFLVTMLNPPRVASLPREGCSSEFGRRGSISGPGSVGGGLRSRNGTERHRGRGDSFLIPRRPHNSLEAVVPGARGYGVV